MNVSVIGQGYVGLAIAINAALAGHRVVGFDTSLKRIQNLKLGISDIEGISNELISQILESGMYIPTSNASEMSESEIVVIAVPTPLTHDEKPDLKYLNTALEAVIEVFQKPVLIINESTSFPGTLRHNIAEYIESKTGLGHLYAVSPERVDPGNKIWNISNTPRLLCGLTKPATEKALVFYSGFCGEIVVTESPEVAEMSKLLENTFRLVNISLVNEIVQISRAMGINPHAVINAAATKPYGFMKFTPGAGIGGHCIPVDPLYLTYAADSVNVPATLIKQAKLHSNLMPSYVCERVLKAQNGSIENKSVLIVGVSYKKNISDTRESPADMVINILRSAGAKVKWHDPLVANWNGETSSEIENPDIVIVLALHDVIDSQEFINSKYVLDCTGELSGVELL